MGKVNGLWMDEHLILDSWDITGMDVAEAISVEQAEGRISTQHSFGGIGGLYCEKCGRSIKDVTDLANYGDCAGVPDITPMVRELKARVR